MSKCWCATHALPEGALPHFVETFLYSGDTDMYRVMRALKEVKYAGLSLQTTFRAWWGGPRVSSAFSIGCMKALVERVNE